MICRHTPLTDMSGPPGISMWSGKRILAYTYLPITFTVPSEYPSANLPLGNYIIEDSTSWVQFRQRLVAAALLVALGLIANSMNT